MSRGHLQEEMQSRPFAYADIYRHPPMLGRDLPPALAAIRKNESGCVVLLPDGTWLATWSQGSFEGALDERIVCAISRDTGYTWSEPRPITASTPQFRRSYGCPFVVPGTGRLYLFLHEGRQHGEHVARSSPEVDAGTLGFMFSDDNGLTWSEIRSIVLPERDISVFPGRIHGHLNHPPQLMPDGRVVLLFSQGNRTGATRRAWQLACYEASLLECENLLTERDPARLRFSLLPLGARGIRADALRHGDNPAVQKLAAAFGGNPVELASNTQEPTVVPLSDGRWLGVFRTYLGSPGYATSRDGGRSWSTVERLRYGPEDKWIDHPHTMCPLARLPDGRFILLFTNNDGTRNGATHVWDGGNRTRNPQWFVIGRELPGEERNGGLIFGEPRILASASDEESPDGFRASTCTGIAMPQYVHAAGRHFVQYGLKKEHILLDEIPAAVIDAMTPALPK
ncbi:MAG: exo-alpha-sialidase [Opitutaceae bacterium]|nr:exo-alpha-sialidase [Opitutaceae bacterium]MBP9914320.1 exo-alpha-sialidase [Opitutaceae bacterium]